MKIIQYKWDNNDWTIDGDDINLNPQLCLLFGTRESLEDHAFYSKLSEKFPESKIVSCSSAGNILGEELLDDVIIATCIEFEHTKIETHLVDFNEYCDENNEPCGKILGSSLANQINGEDLAYILVLSTTKLNAGNFLEGMNGVFKGSVPISGGVAGDNYKFEKTIVGLNEQIGEERVVAISFHGKRLYTYHGSKGGWDMFGPQRTVTRSKGNVVYEIDGKPALDLYKKYLGEKSNQLPGAALHFPLAIIDPKTNEYIVRGVQNTNAEENALILFGDVPENSTIQLMKANFDRVIEGANDAAIESYHKEFGDPDFSILISCVARRLVLNQLTEEELSEAKSALGESTKICGFYSYSELSPIVGDDSCHLHNQTMTITSFYER